MPQASELDRDWVEKTFGSVDPTGPMEWLEGRGWVLEPNWYWKPPKPIQDISEKEWRCVDFLMDEWDFGGIA